MKDIRNVFIINPKAGKGNIQKSLAEKLKGMEVYFTKACGDAKEKAKALAKTGEKIRIFCGGGEGTFFEVLNGTVGCKNIELGVIPCGTANDFLKGFGSKEEFLDLNSQLNGTAVGIDIIKANENYAVNSCSVGMDAIVCTNLEKFKKWPLISGKMAYTLSLIYTFLGKISLDLEIFVNNKKINRKCLFAVCANAPWYGGGYMPAPFANPFDGKLDFTIIKKVSRFGILSLLKTYTKGEHINRSFCESGTCEEIRIKSKKDVPVNLDGEIYYTNDITFSIIKNGAKIILPKNVYKKFEKFSEKHLIFQK